MKKTMFIFLAAGTLLVSGLKAQTIQEGVNHLYAERFKNAIGVFEKMLATNPNNAEASYWLGQTYLKSDEIMTSRIASAKQVYDKANQASNGAPLILVGLGHIELLENKATDARQHFEAALTATRTKKGDDPVIATAIGRAINDAKNADYAWAVRLLEDAASKDPKNTETLLQLGNAYRKAGQGQGGGQAFATYKKALEVNPNFAIASLRLAQLFESQKNWELVLQYLNEAVQKDAKFTAAYYELFYYYFFRAKFPEAEEQLKKYIDSKMPETDIQDQYLYAQLCWARKDFDCANTKAESVIAAMGDKTKPKVYRLLADSYFQKGDFANAKKNSDLFFAKKNVEDVILPDYEIRASILPKVGGTADDVLNAYMQGAALDTTADAKVAFLKKGATYFKENKIRDKEAVILAKLIELKPKPTINDYFDLTLASYFAGQTNDSRNTALKMIELYPDQIYGYEWAYNNSIAISTDTTRPEAFRDSMKLAWTGPDAQKLYEFAQKDTTKFKKQYVNAIRFLAQYYINMKKDKEKSLEFFALWKAADPVNAAAIDQYVEQVKKMTIKPAPTTPNGNAKPAKPKPAPKPVATQKKQVVQKSTAVKK